VKSEHNTRRETGLGNARPLLRCLRPWEELSWDEVKAGGGIEAVVPPLVDEALEARANEFFTCRYCKEKIAPEHGNDEACHGCLSEHEGCVY